MIELPDRKRNATLRAISRQSLDLWALLLIAMACIGPRAAIGQPSWSPDYSISDGDVNETLTSLGNQRTAVVDDSNNLYISFFDNRAKSGNDNNFEIYFRRFTFNFGSPAITRVTDAPNPSRYPTLATRNWGPLDPGTREDSGRIYIAWQDSRDVSIPEMGEPSSSFIYFRTFQSRGGLGFGPEILVSPTDSTDRALTPVVTVGDSSRVFVIWTRLENSNNDLFYAVYQSKTRTMGPPQPLVVDPLSNANLPTVAATRDGKVNLVWVDNRTGRQQLFWKQFIPGSGWTADQQIVTTAVGLASMPSLTASYSGRLHLVWRDTRDGNSEIYYKEYKPGVGWDAVDTRLTTHALTQLEPQVDVDPMDNVYVVWTDFRNGSADQDIFYKERKGGVWQSETPLVYAATDPTNSIQHFPAITHDGTGVSYVAWTDERMGGTPTNTEAFYKLGFGFLTAVESPGRPELARLLRNYPNPFNPKTTVEFTLNHDAATTLRVYDVHGKLVRTLIESYLAAGTRTVTWDGRDDADRAAGSGVYFIRLQAGNQFLSRTVNLLK